MSQPRNIHKERVSDFIALCLRRGVPADALRDFLLMLGVDPRWVEADLPRPKAYAPAVPQWHQSSVGPQQGAPRPGTPPPPPIGAVGPSIPPPPPGFQQNAHALPPPPPVPGQTAPPHPQQHPMTEETKEVSLALVTQTRIRALPQEKHERTAILLGLHAPIKLDHRSQSRRSRRSRTQADSRHPEAAAHARSRAERKERHERSQRRHRQEEEGRREERKAQAASSSGPPIARAKEWLVSLLSANGVMITDEPSSQERKEVESPSVKRAIPRRGSR